MKFADGTEMVGSGLLVMVTVGGVESIVKLDCVAVAAGDKAPPAGRTCILRTDKELASGIIMHNTWQILMCTAALIHAALPHLYVPSERKPYGTEPEHEL